MFNAHLDLLVEKDLDLRGENDLDLRGEIDLDLDKVGTVIVTSHKTSSNPQEPPINSKPALKTYLLPRLRLCERVYLLPRDLERDLDLDLV